LEVVLLLSWEKWEPEMISALPTSSKPAQMVWGAIWLDKCS
jgi:hypothetical protein